jgi:hypothetical protein
MIEAYMLHSFDYLRCHKPTATEEESAAKLMDVTSRLLAGPYSVLAMVVGSDVAFTRDARRLLVVGRYFALR